MDAREPIEIDTFRSPRKKLLRFFHSSRDRWKAKCLRAKSELKLLVNQVRAVEKSRLMWRERFQAAQRKNKELQGELAEQKRVPTFADVS